MRERFSIFSLIETSSLIRPCWKLLAINQVHYRTGNESFFARSSAFREVSYEDGIVMKT